jgi:hypothetical protein
MKKLRRKLLLSIIMLGLTVITVTSTTLAWFANNQTAWVDEFELEIENVEGLLISVDGENFYSSVSNDDLIKAIIAKKDNLDINDLELADVKEEFLKIRLASVTTKDLKSFYTIDNKKVSNNYYELKEAPKGSYIEFDLYFRIVSDDDNVAGGNNVLSIASDSYIKSEARAVKLVNELRSKGVTYHSGESIAVNPADAIRLGIKVHDKDETTLIYEPNLGLGSYAIEGEDVLDDDYDINYDPTENAMLTYFNNLNEYKLAPIKATDKEYYKNTKKFDDNTIISNFEIKEDKTGYEDIKVTVTLWLEGYDADYFVGIDIKSIKMYLNFEKGGTVDE